MSKIVFILLFVFSVVSLTSCSIIYGVDLDKQAQKLELGMSRQEAVEILGNDFYVESASQLPEGKLEVLHFKSLYYNDYLLYFIDGYLTEFHRYIIPTVPEVKVVRED